MARKKKSGPPKSKIVSGIRRIWLYSWQRREVVNRCKTDDGFYRCENCRGLADKVQIDHISPAVPVEGWDNFEGFITRLFVDPSGMRGLCERCHNKKTITEAKKMMRRMSPDVGIKNVDANNRTAPAIDPTDTWPVERKKMQKVMMAMPA